MDTRQKRYIPRLAAVCAAAALVLALAGVAYAADVGGIRQAVQFWFHGRRTGAELDIQGERYTLTYTDEQGNTITTSGVGSAVNLDTGAERPLTAEQIVEGMDAFPQAERREDGSVWVYYQGQKQNITDKFQDGICRVTFRDNGQTLYVTVTEFDSSIGCTVSTQGFSDVSGGIGPAP